MTDIQSVPLDLVQSLAEISNQSEQLRGSLRKVLSPFTLTLDQVLLLQRLQGGPQSVASLAESYQLTPSRMRSVLQSFAELNLVEFVGLPTRGYKLTALGKKVLDSKLPELERLAYFLENRTSKKQLEQLMELMQAVNTDFLAGL